MLISAVQKFTLLDYPNKTACIVFTPGCNFRCGYCHNPEFVLPESIAELKPTFIPEEAFFNFLTSRSQGAFSNLLDGVVITGGEPTLMPDLVSFIERIKKMGFLVKLDSNGNRPEVLEEVIKKNLVDYIAMDFKTDLNSYANLVGKLVKPENIAHSIETLKKNNVEYEFRTTLIREIHSRATLTNMAREIAGAKKLYLQPFRPAHTLKKEFSSFRPFSAEEIEEIKQIFTPLVENVFVR